MTTDTEQELRKRITRQANLILELEKQLGTIYRQNETLYQACEALVELATWMSGSPAVAPGGEAHEGWLRMRDAIDKGKAALDLVRKEETGHYGELPGTYPVIGRHAQEWANRLQRQAEATSVAEDPIQPGDLVTVHRRASDWRTDNRPESVVVIWPETADQ